MMGWSPVSTDMIILFGMPPLGLKLLFFNLETLWRNFLSSLRNPLLKCNFFLIMSKGETYQDTYQDCLVLIEYFAFVLSTHFVLILWNTIFLAKKQCAFSYLRIISLAKFSSAELSTSWNILVERRIKRENHSS